MVLTAKAVLERRQLGFLWTLTSRQDKDKAVNKDCSAFEKFLNFVFSTVLGIEPQFPFMLGQHFIIETHPQPPRNS
jgi:hypothetical protein